MYLTLATLLSVSFFITSSVSAPTVSRRASEPQSAASIIAAIMPGSLSCANAQFPLECRTADQASQPLINAMVKYELYEPGQIAAVLALIGFESVDMQFKHNISPGRPGQGTSAMLMPDNVAAYAASIPEVQAGLAAAGGAPDKVLALVQGDEYNFGAAPWWLVTKCEKGVVEGLKTATDESFRAYMGCVGVTATEERMAYWKRAKAAFGL